MTLLRKKRYVLLLSLLVICMLIGITSHLKNERAVGIAKNLKQKSESLDEVVTEINGKEVSRSALNITFSNGDQVDLLMKMKLSKRLYTVFKHLKHQPTFSFAANMNQDVLSKFVLKKSPEVVKVNFQLDSNQVMHIHQKLYLNAPISSKTKPLFLDTRNYQFLFLNERQQAVAILFDLNLSTWQ
ncbi:hypothetical protein [Exiguobacterium sp. s39]|uniref:hypothetical protein n=1 Tax=Exiguobacterium sp. s39 TaxID=2751198 RepID=UPI0010577DB1|nr:hypothetical protein [Exiguobacterium sp. s39]